MGLRFRKSINLGGGFRINISKSGIGYSWGGKGFRLTHTANGSNRVTASIPDTGISYSQTIGKGKPAVNNSQYDKVQYYDTQNIQNESATQLVSEGVEDIIATIKKSLFWNRLITPFVLIITGLAIFFILMFIASLNSTAYNADGLKEASGLFAGVLLFVSILLITLKIVVMKKGYVYLEYDIDPEQQKMIDEKLAPIVKITHCSKVWRINQTSRVVDTKYSGGAGTTVGRSSCNTTSKVPYPIKCNVDCAVIKSEKEILLFLPDKLLIFQGRKVGALDYSDISMNFETTRFHESGVIPKDSQVVGHAWQYVNKSGGPDKRFANNRQIPICLYGELYLYSDKGLNTIIMYSNPDINPN